MDQLQMDRRTDETPMQTLHRISDLRDRVRSARDAGQRIAFVPTMGNLHAGHLALIEAAREHGEHVVASVFVNPLQFAPNEDLDAYPRTLEADQRALAAAGADLLFAPPVDEMYPDGTALQTRVAVPALGDLLCGASRPGHFEGVATVVTKLFAIVAPDVAVFGRKDFQQLTIIRRLVRDLSLPVEVVGIPTVRADDGLALSSRNGYLSSDERARAPALQQALQRIAEGIRAGDPDFAALEEHGRTQLAASGLRPDYLSVRRSADLQPAGPEDQSLVILGAAWLGRTRLIDNIEINRSLEP